MLLFFRSRVRLYVYLPLEYNPDPEHPERPRAPVPAEHRRLAIREIEEYLGDRFEGLNYELVVRRRVVRGLWRDQERRIITDKMLLVHLDVDLSRRDFLWLKHLKDTVWAARFQQDKMYVIYHGIVEL